jgi:hypothetical protein
MGNGPGALRVQTLRQIEASDALPSPRRLPVALVVGLVAASGLLVAAGWLWFSYGTAVFFEMIASGVAACF